MPVAIPVTIYQTEQGLNLFMHVRNCPNLEIKLSGFGNPSITPSKAMCNFVRGKKSSYMFSFCSCQNFTVVFFRFNAVAFFFFPKICDATCGVLVKCQATFQLRFIQFHAN